MESNINHPGKEAISFTVNAIYLIIYLFMYFWMDILVLLWYYYSCVYLSDVRHMAHDEFPKGLLNIYISILDLFAAQCYGCV